MDTGHNPGTSGGRYRRVNTTLHRFVGDYLMSEAGKSVLTVWHSGVYSIMSMKQHASSEKLGRLTKVRFWLLEFLVALRIPCCMSTYTNLLVLYKILQSLPISNCSALSQTVHVTVNKPSECDRDYSCLMKSAKISIF